MALRLPNSPVRLTKSRMIECHNCLFVLPQEYIFARAVFVLSSDNLIFSASLPGDTCTARVPDDSK